MARSETDSIRDLDFTWKNNKIDLYKKERISINCHICRHLRINDV